MAGERVLSAEQIRTSLNQHPGQTFLETANINHQEGIASATITPLTRPEYGFLVGHTFDGKTVIPGVVQVKMMRDLTTLWGMTLEQGLGEDVVVTSIDARFKGVALVDDKLTATVTNAIFDNNMLHGIVAARASIFKEGESKPIATSALVVRDYVPGHYDPVDVRNKLYMPLPPVGTPKIDRQSLDQLLPQKPPFRFVQSISELVPGERGHGELVPTDDPALEYVLARLGHQQFVSPEFLIEGVAQIGTAVALSTEENRGKVPLFGGINHLEVHNMLEVGQRAQLTVTVSRTRGPLGWGGVNVVRFDGAPILEGELAFAVINPSELSK